MKEITIDDLLDIVDAIVVYSNHDESVVYPVVSYMCRAGYFGDAWECIDDVFYINDKQIIPEPDVKK